MPRPRKNIADVQALTARFEAGILTGPEFSAAVRALPDTSARAADPTYQASTRYEPPVDETVKHTSTPTTQAVLLEVIERHQPITVSRIAHLCDLTVPTAYRQLWRLEDQGLVTRTGTGGYRNPYRFSLRSLAGASARAA